MKQFKIIYNRLRCVGSEKCLVSSYFSMDKEDNRANLNEDRNIREITATLNSKDEEDVINAGTCCPANAIGVFEINKNGLKELVSTEVKNDDGVSVVYAHYDDLKEFKMDKNGYFLIRTIPKTKEIEIGFCRKINVVEIIIRGKKPLEIYQTALKLKLISRMDHAAYLGRELQKAYDSLLFNTKYIQDDELKTNED